MLYQGTNEELYIEDFMFQEYEDQLWQEVELAIKRINDGTYGYCEEIRGSIGVLYNRYSLKIQQ